MRLKDELIPVIREAFKDEEINPWTAFDMIMRSHRIYTVNSLKELLTPEKIKSIGRDCRELEYSDAWGV